MKNASNFRDRFTGLLCLAAFLSIAAGLTGLAPFDAGATTPMSFSAQPGTADMAALKLAMERE